MRDVLHEVYELVDGGFQTKDDFRRMVFETPVRLWTGGNPDFFRGTVVESAVDWLLERTNG